MTKPGQRCLIKVKDPVEIFSKNEGIAPKMSFSLLLGCTRLIISAKLVILCESSMRNKWLTNTGPRSAA